MANSLGIGHYVPHLLEEAIDHAGRERPLAIFFNLVVVFVIIDVAVINPSAAAPMQSLLGFALFLLGMSLALVID